MTGLYGMSGGIGMKISKNKIMITAIIVLCVAVAVLAAVLVIRKDKNKDNDDKMIKFYSSPITTIMRISNEILSMEAQNKFKAKQNEKKE